MIIVPNLTIQNKTLGWDVPAFLEYSKAESLFTLTFFHHILIYYVSD